ncbi:MULTISPECIES: hypothetical protein [unclassified Pedobacter]|uniref:hypothetical protein n=1 Tax=unclassified Pedobacter TaxID=2628915 RepID=UPI0014209693|nr:MULTISPECIES: hypothetical protein [unclassified Pedobacter]NII81525.1 hypothetical protein [Pedobacter sp. SG908]NMN35529.1 hypothetical protein [Pedobacter sp. SG918]
MKKQIFILLAIMIIATTSYAQVILQSFQIGQNYLQGTSLKVANINSATPFKFLVSVTRGINSGGGFVSGNCTIKLYYTENQSSDSNIPDDPTSLLLFTKNITSSDYNSSQVILADLDASLPANKQYGKILVKFEFVDNQNINRVSYSSTRYGIYVVPTTPPSPVEINGLVTYPAVRNLTYINQPFPLPFENNPIGIKLPEEKLDLKWDQTKLNTPEVFVTLFSTTSTVAITKIKITNNGSYSFNFSSLNLGFYFNSYYIKIENSVGDQYGKSGTFRFLNDHLPLWNGNFPSSYTNANWIFRPDSSGSYNGLYAFWFSGRINASNVIVDLYDSNGNFFKRLSESTPNTGAFYYQSDDNVIPRTSTSFYQYKITSKENPSEFGYSEVFNWWYD